MKQPFQSKGDAEPFCPKEKLASLLRKGRAQPHPDRIYKLNEGIATRASESALKEDFSARGSLGRAT